MLYTTDGAVAGAFAVLLAVVVPVAGAAQSAAPDSELCGQWSTPLELWTSPLEVGTLQPMEKISVVPAGDRTFVVAGFRAWPGDSAHDVLIAPVPGSPLPPPPGGLYYIAPLAAVDGEGTLHLVWVEPDEGSGPEVFEEDERGGLHYLFSGFTGRGGSSPFTCSARTDAGPARRCLSTTDPEWPPERGAAIRRSWWGRARSARWPTSRRPGTGRRRSRARATASSFSAPRMAAAPGARPSW